MKIRFGYVSHAMSLWDASPAKTVTFTRYQQLDAEERKDKLLLDQALLKLVDDLSKIRGIKRVSGGSVELK